MYVCSNTYYTNKLKKFLSHFLFLITDSVTMSLMQAVENRLRSIDDWPSYILKYLFCDLPTPTILKKLIAFSMETMFHVQWLFNYIMLATVTQMHM